MKRITSLLFVLILLIPVQFFVNEDKDESVIYLKDGRYIIATTKEFGSYAFGSKNAQRFYTAGNGVVCLKATLTANFSYTSSSATCTSSDRSVVIYESNCGMPF